MGLPWPFPSSISQRLASTPYYLYPVRTGKGAESLECGGFDFSSEKCATGFQLPPWGLNSASEEIDHPSDGDVPLGTQDQPRSPARS